MKPSSPAAWGGFIGGLVSFMITGYWQHQALQAANMECGLPVVAAMCFVGIATMFGSFFGNVCGRTGSWWKGCLIGAGAPQVLVLIPWVVMPEHSLAVLCMAALGLAMPGVVIGGLTGAVGQLASRGIKMSEEAT